jgi:hypothetical protein
MCRTIGGAERGVKGQKELIDWFFDDWIDGNSIGHDPLIIIEGVGLILVGISKTRSPSFPRQKYTKNRFYKVSYSVYRCRLSRLLRVGLAPMSWLQGQSV